jgi:hypothetical protein
MSKDAAVTYFQLVFRYFLGGTRTNRKRPLDYRSAGLEFNHGSPGCEAGELTTQTSYSVEGILHDKWVPVTTAWGVLRLRMEERTQYVYGGQLRIF